MKKLFTIVLVVFSLALVLSSCTEQEVKPVNNSSVSAGSVSKQL